jgi:NNP family nitrate/nitrite transporter-like MFS transporter
MATWLTNWKPEDNEFWKTEGKSVAWKTLIITTLSLLFSFATWFMMSAVVTKLPGIGFSFTTGQLFWLAAMPGLAGGTLRLIHMFLIPIYGTRHTISFSTIIKLIPVLGLGLAVMNPGTPFWVFMVIALTTGFGGGDFSSYMPSTSLFFPKRMIGTALGIQAGIGNFGVSVAQFMTPVMIGVATLGASQVFTKVESKEIIFAFKQMETSVQIEHFLALDEKIQEKLIAKIIPVKRDSFLSARGEGSEPELFASISAKEKAACIVGLAPKLAEKVLLEFRASGVKNKNIFVQSAAFWYVPFLLVLAVICWFFLRSVPVKASFRDQLDIFKDKHTWFCTITYILTFGTFSGLSAAFPMMIKSLYGSFDGAPDPLAFAFYGPLIGSASRVIFGFVADKTGGAILTTITGIGLLAGVLVLISFNLVDPESMAQFPLFVGVMLTMFFFTGIGNAATFRQYPVVFSHNQRQAAGVIGFTAAIAAYGPFLFSSIIGAVIQATTNANGFFYGLLVFIVLATLINWYYYNRKGCERPS